MNVTVRPVGQIYSTEDKEKLETIGFRFERHKSPFFSGFRGSPGENWIRQTDSVQVEMNSLEDLLAFAAKWGDLIIEKDGTVRIYDDCNE